MLIRTVIFIALTVAILFLVDWSSVVVPCFLEKAPPGIEKSCPYAGGIVLIGLKRIETWKPEQWMAATTVVTAAFTMVLGLFALSLARSTRIAANAANANAEAMMAADGAHLLPVIKEQNLGQMMNLGQITAAAARHPSTSPPTERTVPLRIRYRLRNHGKTPAILNSVMHRIAFFADPTSVRAAPVEDNVAVQVIASDAESSAITAEMAEPFTADMVNAVAADKGDLVFYGEASFRDFFGRQFRCSWEFDASQRGFALIKHDQRLEAGARS